jgi:hypothetical protein
MALSRIKKLRRTEALKDRMLAEGVLVRETNGRLRVADEAGQKENNPGAAVQESQRKPRREYSPMEVYIAANMYCYRKRVDSECPCTLRGQICEAGAYWKLREDHIRNPALMVALEDAGRLK